MEKMFQRSLHPEMFLAMGFCAVGPLPSLLVIYTQKEETWPTPFRAERRAEPSSGFSLEMKVHPGNRRLQTWDDAHHNYENRRD